VRDLALALNEMLRLGVIRNYALFGAVAQMRYTEPVATLDADVLIATPDEGSLEPLRGVYGYCRQRGWPAEGEAVRIGKWPTQFIPAFDALTREAMEHAETADFEGTPLRVVRADYLAVIALGVGRATDFARVLALLESGATSREQVGVLAIRHDRTQAWRRFQERFLDA
jgi:hypothetical protein